MIIITVVSLLSPSRVTNRKSRPTSFEDYEDEDASLSDNLESPNLFLYRENEGVDDKETQTKRKAGEKNVKNSDLTKT
jgi:hypothetical protein